ncbi:MAG TPA: type IV pilin protein [Steroidobacteraceae bacterium]|nr:type IV pilin protein [Steroidobacteraceae bacterium]
MQYRNRGVTLIELMVVMIVIGILGAIAYPSYRQYLMRGGRSEAKTLLMQQAQALEKCFTRYGRYNDNVNCAATTQVINGVRYRVGPAAAGDILATTFVLTAVRQGPQAGDAACGNFTLDDRNVRNVTGPDGAQACW